MNKNWPGIATAVAIAWIAATVLMIGIAGPLWFRGGAGQADIWSGFAGNVLGALSTGIAAALALFAAYKTLQPMQQQLRELTRQTSSLTMKGCVNVRQN